MDTTRTTESSEQTRSVDHGPLGRDRAGADETPTAPLPRAPWTLLGAADPVAVAEPPLSSRRLLLQLVVAVIAVLAVVTIGGSLAARRLAEREAVADAADTADVLAEGIVQPAITDALIDGDPDARAAFDAVVRRQILGGIVVRVRLWRSDGTIAYADQASLEGKHFGLEDEEREALASPRTEAEISDLSRPENALDRIKGEKLVEVYRPVWTPDGRTALFEIYESYDQVSRRSGQLWRGFAGVTLSTLLLFVVLLAPVVVHLLGRARRAQEQREHLLRRAVDASSAERRRIAATLHDGPVQDLAATSFVVAGATASAENGGNGALAEDLRTVSASVRTSIRALRTLLVEIYPPSLSRAGLGAALADLGQTVRAEGLQVRLLPDADDALGLDGAQERLVYRVAEETLRNAAKHAAPGTVTLTLRRHDHAVKLEVVDDGPGFDVAERLREPAPGHLGLQLLCDLAADAGATLEVATAPGAGTHWRLTVPDHEEPRA
ncbi:integral membrane sensor signal transduction histidine kinase [Nocardioides mangrovicus]|uniref:Integral membrane sensor signal transduction histidine kinase n=1 Tax=Nocardioides mangrovicus TaxID=2478913 RepID=A0A3L8P2A0_9ACTN|nr:ATP-binding protein [Nocardioides mangrovicus]RLV49516.1 integral membrane sensor signal transduction histidine kinase [Nocardioides mangrovicus]